MPSPTLARLAHFDEPYERRTTVRPTVWRCSIASSAAGSSANGTSWPTIARSLPAANKRQQLGVQLLAVAMRGEVESAHALEHHRVVDVRVAHADEREVPEQHRPRHEPLVFLLDARREAGEDVAAVERHAPERLQRHVAAHRVERDVDAAAVGRVEHRLHEVGLPVVDRELGAELAAQLRLLGGSRGREHARAGVHAELERGRARAARARVHEQRLARLHAGPFVEREPREMERHEDRGRFGLGHVGRHLERHARRRDDVLGVAAERARRDRDDTPAEPRLGAGSALLDDAEHFHARDVRHRSRHRLVPAVDAVEIVEVQRHRRDADLQLAVARCPARRRRRAAATSRGAPYSCTLQAFTTMSSNAARNAGCL